MADSQTQDSLNTDVIASYRQNLQYEESDDNLLMAINNAIKESYEYKAKVDKCGEKNKMYWKKGTDKDFSTYHKKQSKTVVNRIFTDVETAIPIISANTPEATIIGDVTNDVREKIQDGLEIAYEVNYKMQLRLQTFLRHWFLYKVGILKYRWDKGFVTENVLPKKIGIDKRATCKDNCEYVWEELEDTAENLVEKFPKKQKDILGFIGNENLKAKLKYIEFWGGRGEWLCWAILSRNLILDKKKNPNFDYENEENNIFENPQFPYIFLNVFNLGDGSSLYDETSLIEECMPIQDGINQLEQQILDLNEGQKRVWVASGEAMSEKKAQDLVNKTGDLMVYLDRKAPTSSLGQVQSGKPDASLYNNLTHLLGEVDNVMGIHSTTRGDRAQQETYGRSQLLMSSDIGRMDMIVRNVEQTMEEWYNSYLHMIKVYAIEPVTLRSSEKTIEIKPEEIPNGLMVMVKKGSTLPTDDRTRMDMAQQLAAAGMIDPKTLFEEMGYANTDQRVQDLMEWLQATGKVIPQGGQVGQTGVTNVGQGGVEQENVSIPSNSDSNAQLARIQAMMQSPDFQKLPPEEQMQMVQQAKVIVQKIKGGGNNV